MCGIFALLNILSRSDINEVDNITAEFIRAAFNEGQSRGPENSQLLFHTEANWAQGFHRLAINGLNEAANQPLNMEDCSLICNGEIYNYRELYTMMGIVPSTGSDCEVIIHLYRRYGIDHTLRLLDGVFAFVLRTPEGIFVARDPLGVRPLYYIQLNEKETSLSRLFGFASELKCLYSIANQNGVRVAQMTPGTYMHFMFSEDENFWRFVREYRWFTLNFTSSFVSGTDTRYLDYYIQGIRRHLTQAVKKRYLTTERPIACLLSGGLDSSLIAALVCDIHRREYELGTLSNKTTEKSMLVPIETYSIGLPNSEDIKYARIVAQHIHSHHTEVIISEEDVIKAIPVVIRAIESYDITTIRASIGNYLIGKFIKEHSNAKVVFNGDGSDELFGGYLYMSACPNSLEYDRETARLLQDIHLFDVLRSDKCISSHGLEPRTPFLDKTFVNYCLSIPLEYRNHNLQRQPEKYLLRNAFRGTGLLPDEILWRRKEAFSDGVSMKGKSLYIIIQDYLADSLKDVPEYIGLTKKEIEKKYYRSVFEEFYPNHAHVLPYYWMPKYVVADDPSARTLEIYKTT